MHLLNNTPFQAMAVPTVCQQDKNHLVLIVKASFDIAASGHDLVISEQQQDIFLADQYWGEPGESSLRYESDIALHKPGTDVALIGTVYPQNPPVRVAEAKVSVGSYSKHIRAFGDRHWIKNRSGYQISQAQSFEKMPLIFENAYGGQCLNEASETSSFDARNPFGKGFFDTESKLDPDNLALPNLENPQQLITDIRQQPEPWCTGFVARDWAPRNSYAGTYDDNWLKNRNPLLPSDFDVTVNNAASTNLVLKPYLQGGELMQLENLSPQGTLAFQLPSISLKLETAIKGQRNQHQAVIDTVVIEPDESRVSMTWRAALQIHWNLSMIEWIKINWRQEGRH